MKRPIKCSKYIKGLRPIREVAFKHRAKYKATCRAAARAARDCNQVFICRSSYRTFKEQTALYVNYTNGTGNLAAVPGTSVHEFGAALDLGNEHNIDIGRDEKASAALKKQGFVFAVKNEPWHVEYKKR